MNKCESTARTVEAEFVTFGSERKTDTEARLIAALCRLEALHFPTPENKQSYSFEEEAQMLFDRTGISPKPIQLISSLTTAQEFLEKTVQGTEWGDAWKKIQNEASLVGGKNQYELDLWISARLLAERATNNIYNGGKVGKSAVKRLASFAQYAVIQQRLPQKPNPLEPFPMALEHNGIILGIANKQLGIYNPSQT